MLPIYFEPTTSELMISSTIASAINDSLTEKKRIKKNTKRRVIFLNKGYLAIFLNKKNRKKNKKHFFQQVTLQLF